MPAHLTEIITAIDPATRDSSLDAFARTASLQTLLAECEGIFSETAGGVTVGVAKKLIAAGKIPASESAVLCITGNGLKTLDAVAGHVGEPREIKPSLREFEALLAQEESGVTA